MNFKKKLLIALCLTTLSPLVTFASETAAYQPPTDYTDLNFETQKDLQLKAEIDALVSNNRSAQSYEEKVKEALIAVNPKLGYYNDGDFTYNPETGYIDFTISKDDMFSTTGETRASAWSLLARGDILINHSNGSSGLNYGHAALMDIKNTTVSASKTYEILGIGSRVAQHNYSAWHNDNGSKMSYNYLQSRYNQGNFDAIISGTMKKAKTYEGMPYNLQAFNNASTAAGIYCSQLVYLAYYHNGIEYINLGNGKAYGGANIILPNDIYQDNDINFYYRQGF
ncbi:MAG: hypothetical protein ACRDD4_10055 [Culicoidibacterales bacterium]